MRRTQINVQSQGQRLKIIVLKHAVIKKEDRDIYCVFSVEGQGLEINPQGQLAPGPGLTSPINTAKQKTNHQTRRNPKLHVS